MPTQSILLLGSIAYDYIMQFPGDFNTNLTSDPQKNVFNLAVMPESKTMNFGGTAGNISYNLGLTQTPTSVITSVGKDFTELGYSSRFQVANVIKFWGKEHSDDHTASCYIVNDNNHNQIIIFHEGAMKRCPNINLVEQGVSQETVKIASVSPDNPQAMVKWAKELIKMNIPFIFDPGQMVHYFSKPDLEEIIPKAYLLIGNEFEIMKIQELLSMDMEGLLSSNSTIIITRGENGSECYSGENHEHISVGPITSIEDTTGAGDGYRAGLLYGLYNELPLVTACRIGAIISARVIGTIGPQTQKYTLGDVRETYRQMFHEDW
ncbi:MAG: carbohydrate kinase family protein [Promethearchaeota archaeon]